MIAVLIVGVINFILIVLLGFIVIDMRDQILKAIKKQ
jgi:hypothetical protein